LGRRTNIGQFFEEFHRFVTGQGDERTDIRDGAGITWDATGAVSKSPKGMVIQDGAYVGMD